MSKTSLRASIILAVLPLVISVHGCGSHDDQYEQLARESLARQAEQNELMARQSQATADATKALVEAEAESRREYLGLQDEIQSERANLDRQHESLEQERKSIANERRWESFLGPLITSTAGLIVAALPLVVCLFLLKGLFQATPDEEIGNVLIQELVADKPLLLPPSDRMRVTGIDGTTSAENHKALAAPTAAPETKLLVVVEGQHDVAFLRHVNAVLHARNEEVPDLAKLETSGKVIFVPTGGGDLRQWTDRFAGLGHRELHLYDRETPPLTDKRRTVVEAVNQREGCRAILTQKRAIENYLHPQAIRESLGVDVSVSDFNDVAGLVASALLTQKGSDWKGLNSRRQRKLQERAKQRIHRQAVPRMTAEMLAERDPEGEVLGWFASIAASLA